jgi:hypothetical protein
LVQGEVEVEQVL